MTCQDIIQQFCTNNPEKCGIDAEGNTVILQEHLPEYFEQAEGCTPSSSTSNQGSGLLNIKSDEFLGGLNVHNVIIIFLLLMILFTVNSKFRKLIK